MFRTITKITAFLFCCTTYFPVFSQLTLEDIFIHNKYQPKSPAEYEFMQHQPAVMQLVQENKKSYLVFKDMQLKEIQRWQIGAKAEAYLQEQRWSGYVFAPSEKKYLVKTSCARMYRHAEACSYYVGDAAGNLQSLSYGEQYFPAFSSSERYVAFVRDNNIFIKDLQLMQEIQVTKDGKWNHIINGKSDWVYEEELELQEAFQWHPSGKKMAYLKFDESKVKEYAFPMQYRQNYPTSFSYKYPKAGEENAQVAVWLYDVQKRKNKLLKIPYDYEYIPRFYWTADGSELVLMLLNRHQNKLQLAAYNITTGKSRILYEENDPAYVDVPQVVEFLYDGSFIISSEKDGFNHLYHYDNQGQLIRQLTSGNYEVTDICLLNEQKNELFFQSNEGDVKGRYLYKLNYRTLEKTRLSDLSGTHTARFSPSGEYYLHTYSSARQPKQTCLRSVLQPVSVCLEKNEMLDAKLDFVSDRKYMQIPAGDISLEAWMLLPANMDSLRRYPLLMYVYGGPGNQEVLDEWPASRDLFFNYLTEQGYIVACVDNRGSGGKGAAFKKSTYLQLGKLETEDQVKAARYFASLPYVDSGRIGIFGWSYGGMMAALAVSDSSRMFKAAVAVAPVTNWEWYDNIYTERYMRTPKENTAGYQQNSVLTKAGNMNGHLLLMHGTADDNVHVQHTLAYTQQL
ncbi:MAG: S9 family peptidase, partial [Chitinophagales bacterium]|nr:S9 family peptidase [Chitinophagales bacterium]